NRIYLTDGYLSVIDLNNLQLDAELAVLSACNTGSGQLLRGEGVMSLARSFMTAGCNSTLMSLWAVNDCTTSDIMLNFYKELEKGLPKNEALRQAKLQYIAQASQEYAHPYYWGAFLQFGNSRAMELQHRQPSSIWWMLALALGLVAVFFFFKSRS
ncbi:MAG: CHAT domain-containing protein, partial [Bacteroidota bacterium]